MLGQAMTHDDRQRWVSSGWEHPHRSWPRWHGCSSGIPNSPVNASRAAVWPQFDFLLCLAFGFRQHRPPAFYSLGDGGAEELAVRLHKNDSLRGVVARSRGLTLEDFDSRADDALAEVDGFRRGFADASRARALLISGKRY